MKTNYSVVLCDTMMFARVVLVCVVLTPTAYGETTKFASSVPPRFGNLSIEFLYRASLTVPDTNNLVGSALTLWSWLAVTHEGAIQNTKREIGYLARIPTDRRNTAKIRSEILDTIKWLDVNSSTLSMASTNRILENINDGPFFERDFLELAQQYYQFQHGKFNLMNKKAAAESIRNQIYSSNHGRLPNLVTIAYFSPSDPALYTFLMISAFHFRGVWASKFKVQRTAQARFYDDTGRTVIGEVFMMHNRYNYPLANIKELQASIIELPYGEEKRVSMLILLPKPGVTTEDLLRNFQRVPLDNIFEELARSQHVPKPIDCFIPKFRINSNIVLNDMLPSLGVYDLLDKSKARLHHMNRWPYYVSQVVHKAEMEVTEFGTRPPTVTVDTDDSESMSDVAGNVTTFRANRPFVFFIVEKVTNSIVAQGLYRQPSLYIAQVKSDADNDSKQSSN